MWYYKCNWKYCIFEILKIYFSAIKHSKNMLDQGFILVLWILSIWIDKILVWIPPVILKTLKRSLLLALIWINFNSGKRWNSKDLKCMSLSLTFPLQHRDPGFKPQAWFTLCAVSEGNRREKSFLFYTLMLYVYILKQNTVTLQTMTTLSSSYCFHIHY